MFGITIVVLIAFSCISAYSKSIDLNGIKVSLETTVSKKSISIGSGVNEEKYNTTEYEKEVKDEEDRYVQAELTIRNDNNYEMARVTIEEVAPVGFRQLDSGKNEKIINAKIESKSERKYKYKYKFHKSYLKDQDSSIFYDENGDIIDNNKNVSVELNNNDSGIDINSGKNIDNKIVDKGNLDEGITVLKKGATRILLFLIVFVLCIIFLIVFMMFYKTIKGNDNYFNEENPFRCIIIFMLLSIVISIIFKQNSFAKSIYVPQIYEYGKTYEKVIYQPVDFDGTVYNFAYKITVTYESSHNISDEDYENDTDGDGLIDALEYQYMTNKNSVDTDNDGLSDYLEVMFLDYNPLSDDTFNDGVKDGDRDYDNDKLTNIEEINYGTDLFNVDTDYDTLTDYDEINIHNTNPLSTDTDEDLLLDPDELKLDLDPNNPRTDGVTLDSERKIEQTYNISNVPEELRQGDIFIKNIRGVISGNIDKEIKISKNNEELFNSMSSFVQSGFKVELKEGEKIDIVLDASKVSERKTTLIIVKYENEEIEAIDTICDGNDLKARIGSGTYSVMDSEIVLRDLNIFINDYMP